MKMFRRPLLAPLRDVTGVAVRQQMQRDIRDLQRAPVRIPPTQVIVPVKKPAPIATPSLPTGTLYVIGGGSAIFNKYSPWAVQSTDADEIADSNTIVYKNSKFYWIGPLVATAGDGFGEGPLYVSDDAFVTVATNNATAIVRDFAIASDDRIWAVIDDSGTIKVAYSDDEGATFTPSRTLTDDMIGHLAVHPTDPNRIAVLHGGAGVSNNEARADVTTNRGSSWSTLDVDARDFWLSGNIYEKNAAWLHWLSTGRLVAIYTVRTTPGDSTTFATIASYSDNDGASWTPVTVLARGTDPPIAQSIAAADDTLFALFWRGDETNAVQRSIDGGVTWTGFDAPTTGAPQPYGMTWEPSSRRLYGLWAGPEVWYLPNGKTTTAGWISVADVPADADQGGANSIIAVSA